MPSISRKNENNNYILIYHRYMHGYKMVRIKLIIFTAIVSLTILFSGCTGGQDINSVVEALPEVQQILNEHPNAKITVTYWSKEEIAQSVQEISQQCEKTIASTAMYKAIISEEDLKIISWINADNLLVICSTTQGSGSQEKTPTVSIVVANNADTIEPDYKIIHKGGDTLKGGDWKLSIVPVGSEPIYIISNAGSDLSVEHTIIVSTTTEDATSLTNHDLSGEMKLSSGSKYDIKLFHIPSNKILVDQILEVRSHAPTASIVVANNADTTEPDYKIIHKGGDTLKGGDWKLSIVPIGSEPVYIISNVGSDLSVGHIIMVSTTTMDATSLTNHDLSGEVTLASGSKYDVKLFHIPSNAILIDQVVEVR